MEYKEILVEGFEGVVQKHILINNNDGSIKSFPADENNPEYVAFLQHLKTESDKV